MKVILLLIFFCHVAYSQPLQLDFKYSPETWQTLIAFKDDWQKAQVSDKGELLLDHPGTFGADYGTVISIGAAGARFIRESQRLHSPKVPFVETYLTSTKGIELKQDAFSVVAKDPSIEGSTRIVAIISEFKGKNFFPTLTIDSQNKLTFDSGLVRSNEQPFLITRPTARKVIKTKFGLKLIFEKETEHLEVLTAQGTQLQNEFPFIGDLKQEKLRALDYWTHAELPWNKIRVPDANVQALLDSSVRNIYQSREVKNGVPEYRTGPTDYRGVWVVDGAFIFEVATWFGDSTNVRKAIDHIMSYQKEGGFDDGRVAFMQRDGFFKETGIMLWTIFRHAQLTHDKNWLRSQWPKIEKAVNWIVRTREATANESGVPYAGLMPPGFPDGGIDGIHPEYTNDYWNLSGMKAAVDAAKWMGLSNQFNNWNKEYKKYKKVFEKAAARDLRQTESGISYLPILMNFDPQIDAPQKAQWAFLHAIFPGKIFENNDQIMSGTLSMLDSYNTEGLVQDTGWMDHGLWTYFGSFYAHAHLWKGNFKKAQETLYAFGNHASPLLTWREEQMPKGYGFETFGDMPHNWASAEFIRLVRHLIALERGNEIHFLEGVPEEWYVPGAEISLTDMASEFGKINFSLKISQDGNRAELKVGSLEVNSVIYLKNLKRLGFKQLNEVIRNDFGKELSLVFIK